MESMHIQDMQANLTVDLSWLFIASQREDLPQLADSIKKAGLLKSLTVVETDRVAPQGYYLNTPYMLVFGYFRYCALCTILNESDDPDNLESQMQIPYTIWQPAKEVITWAEICEARAIKSYQ